MSKLNLNQKKLIAEAIMNLSVACISISIITPIVYRFKYDPTLLIIIFIIFIIVSLMSISSVTILKK